MILKLQFRPAFLIFPLLMLFLSGCKTAERGQVMLKLNMPEGTVYEYRMDMQMAQHSGNQEAKSEMLFGYTMEVVNISGGIKNIRVTYDHIAMSMEIPGMDALRVDSRDTVPDDDRPFGRILTRMVQAMSGQSFSVRMNMQGEVIAVDGIDRMENVILQSLDTEPVFQNILKERYREMFNEETIAQGFQYSFNILPDKPVNVGDSWEKDMVRRPTGFSIKTKYTVREIQEYEVLLDLSSVITGPGTSGEQEGSIRIEKASGLVTQASLNQLFSGHVEMKNMISIRGQRK